tara:strand:+ start:48559 stop:48687 length:129 start_codon:yes stop_codon:yes gene_type:complete
MREILQTGQSQYESSELTRVAVIKNGLQAIDENGEFSTCNVA